MVKPGPTVINDSLDRILILGRGRLRNTLSVPPKMLDYLFEATAAKKSNFAPNIWMECLIGGWLDNHPKYEEMVFSKRQKKRKESNLAANQNFLGQKIHESSTDKKRTLLEKSRLSADFFISPA